MLFKEIGVKGNPTMILLHGGGLSDWSLQGVVEKLKNEFYVITPIIDGHGEDGHEDFVSIENSATKLIIFSFFYKKRGAKIARGRDRTL